MYGLFYNFIIEELLVKFFNSSEIEPGEKYYIVIEDEQTRREFMNALKASDYTESFSLKFPTESKFSKIDASPYETSSSTLQPEMLPYS